MKTATIVRFRFAIVLTLGIAAALGAGCGTDRQGWYLGKGATEDVELYVQNACLIWDAGHLYCVVPHLNKLADSRLWLYPAGGTFPSGHFAIADAAWQLDWTFSTTVASVDDPGKTGTLVGQAYSSAGDLEPPDGIEGTLVLEDGARYFVARRLPGGSNYDDYKCPNGPGACGPALGAPTSCVVNPLSGGGYQLAITAPYKEADANLAGGQVGVGFGGVAAASGPTIATVFGPLPGTGTVGDMTITSSLTGTTAGEVSVSLADPTLTAAPTGGGFAVINTIGASSNGADCILAGG
ncbi:MAG: hypothetical protein IPK07_17145 [Deltaproteobacteria bacterium]|nr:hypothetical protein [Deltaproteobacteria bacterium]